MTYVVAIDPDNTWTREDAHRIKVNADGVTYDAYIVDVLRDYKKNPWVVLTPESRQLEKRYIAYMRSKIVPNSGRGFQENIDTNAVCIRTHFDTYLNITSQKVLLEKVSPICINYNDESRLIASKHERPVGAYLKDFYKFYDIYRKRYKELYDESFNISNISRMGNSLTALQMVCVAHFMHQNKIPYLFSKYDPDHRGKKFVDLTIFDEDDQAISTSNRRVPLAGAGAPARRLDHLINLQLIKGFLEQEEIIYKNSEMSLARQFIENRFYKQRGPKELSNNNLGIT